MQTYLTREQLILWYLLLCVSVWISSLWLSKVFGCSKFLWMLTEPLVQIRKTKLLKVAGNPLGGLFRVCSLLLTCADRDRQGDI